MDRKVFRNIAEPIAVEAEKTSAPPQVISDRERSNSELHFNALTESDRFDILAADNQTSAAPASNTLRSTDLDLSRADMRGERETWEPGSLAADDVVYTGPGDDFAFGGRGSDFVYAEGGDDILIFVALGNLGQTDVYDGGAGHDVLRLYLSSTEWQNSAFQAELAAWLEFSASSPDLIDSVSFEFASLGLSISAIEDVSVLVDGIEVDLVEETPGTVDLGTLDGTNGFVINGIDAYDYIGWSVSSAGDLNGDGIDDILIGTYEASPNGEVWVGETYVVFGSTAAFDASFELSGLDGTNGFVINGIDAYDFSGWSVSSAGDVNGDGIDDILIGATDADPNGTSNAGETYVVFGSTTPFGASFDLSGLDGTNGFVINGVDASDSSGYSVSSAGDVNGDGIDDILIGASGADPNGGSSAGETYVVFGSTAPFGASFDLSGLDGTNGFVVNGIDASDSSGYSVSSAGDVNGDGIDDILIGAFGADPNGASSAGETYVIFGSTAPFDASFDLSGLDGTNGFVINGIDASDFSGGSVSSAGDVNGDGIDDILIGAHLADPNGGSSAGETYVVFGSTTPLGASVDLSGLDGTNGFVVNGIDASDSSGYSVSSAGDVNGDGIDDILIGAYLADPNGSTSAGETYVVFGSTTPFDASFDLSGLDGTNGFVVNGIDASDYSGYSVSSAGDVNGDGIDDILIGATGADPNGVDGAGETYVVFGREDFEAVVEFSALTATDAELWL